MGRRNKSRDSTSEGKQHFSHSHVLKPVNPAEVETLTCNACEQPNNNNNPNFYGCNSCQYFLHENCFNAPRFLHHSSHSSHPLTLLATPTYSTRSYTCKACGSAGNGFCFSCACCEFDVHLQCASSPSSLLVDIHPHQLELLFGSPFEEHIVYSCDVCNIIMKTDDWLYYCDGCDFMSHLPCTVSPEVGVFPIQQPHPNPNSNSNPHPNPNSNSNPNPNPNTNTNSAVEMINAANEAHDQIIAAQIRARIEAQGRAAALSLWD